MDPARPSLGAPAPDLSLIDGSGRPWTLADQQGHVVVLIFHRHIH